MPPAPTSAWVPGRWEWNGYDYDWIPGKWVRTLYTDAVWVPAHWEWNGYDWDWVPGY